MKLFVYDDRVADGWHPFALSRPVAELRFGVFLQRRRLERFAGESATGLLTRPWLADFTEPGAPPVMSREEISDGEDRLLLNARLVPAADAGPGELRGPTLLTVDEVPVGCYLPAGAPTPGPEWLASATEAGARDELAEAEKRPVEGRLLAHPWELVERGPEQTARDVEAAAPAEARRDPGSLPDDVWLRGGGDLFLEEEVEVEPGVLFETTAGPVWLARGVQVRSGCRLRGPLYAGPDSVLLGGSMGSLAAGSVCHLRGEISRVTLVGHVNKAHAGYLGHACLGRWVNLGAGTTNSDLKNNYGPVRLGGPSGARETGLLKFGCLLGDHVKTAIGTLLGTGTAVGAGANLFGDGRPPVWVPPFSWGFGEDADVYRRDEFLETARTVMERREVPFRDGTRRWLASVWDAARARSTTAADGGAPTGGEDRGP